MLAIDQNTNTADGKEAQNDEKHVTLKIGHFCLYKASPLSGMKEPQKKT